MTTSYAIWNCSPCHTTLGHCRAHELSQRNLLHTRRLTERRRPRCLYGNLGHDLWNGTRGLHGTKIQSADSEQWQVWTEGWIHGDQTLRER